LCAILTARQPRELDIALFADFSDAKSDEDFWARMAKKGLMYDRCLGVEVSSRDFPQKILELVDDPFRSIAWLIRKMGAFEDLRQPYQEFRIADFLRQHMVFTPAEHHEFETACVRAFELMRSPEAAEWADKHGLPGMKTGKVPDDLVSMYYDVLTAARRPRFYRQ
ncbi:MAG: ParB/Srx family N-terminal domain-containing protein, partial [Myxococcota bacterium]